MEGHISAQIVHELFAFVVLACDEFQELWNNVLLSFTVVCGLVLQRFKHFKALAVQTLSGSHECHPVSLS